MKKLVSLLLCVIMVMALMSISASAEEPITLTIERSEPMRPLLIRWNSP